MNVKPHIVIVEDDINQAKRTARILQSNGYELTLLVSGEQLFEQVRRRKVDLVIMDWSLPGQNGFETFQAMQKVGVCPPVIFLTGNSDENLVASSLDAGVEDYIVKPVSIVELLARIRKALGRVSVSETALSSRDSMLRIINGELIANGNRQHLTESEKKLISLFLQNEDILLSRNDIAISLWGATGESETSRSVDVIVSRLRKKLSKIGDDTFKIRSRYGVGYVMERVRS